MPGIRTPQLLLNRRSTNVFLAYPLIENLATTPICPAPPSSTSHPIPTALRSVNSSHLKLVLMTCCWKLRAVGVCGSDLHQWTAQHSWPVNYPVVLGHEFGGVIVDTGANVAAAGRWKSGDRAVSETAAVIDLDNPMTRRGLYNLDTSRKGFGYGVNGAMTRYVRVPSRCLHHVPADLELELAALTEPCCVAYNAVINNSRIRPGDRVVVLGPGTIGILCAAVARLAGAEVAMVGLEADQGRLKVAESYGCQSIVGDAGDWALARDGLGADCVIDAAGVSATLEAALNLVRPAGWITKVGWGPAAAQLLARSPRSEERHPSGEASATIGRSGNPCCNYLRADNWMSNPSSVVNGPSLIGRKHSRKCTTARS